MAIAAPLPDGSSPIKQSPVCAYLSVAILPRLLPASQLSSAHYPSQRHQVVDCDEQHQCQHKGYTGAKRPFLTAGT